MVKCAVSGCPNRAGTDASPGIFNRPPKRFFSFPGDPARVKVWLAALRETDRQVSPGEHQICEDHFLPEDIFPDGVSTDAIPIMPPCLDGHLGMIGPWGGETSEEEDEWASGDDADTDDAGGEDDAPAAVPPAADPPQQDPDANKTPVSHTPSIGKQQRNKTVKVRWPPKPDWSLRYLAPNFLEMLQKAPGGLLDLRQVTMSLQTRPQRVYDITSILFGINLIEKQSPNKIRWKGKFPIDCLLVKNQEKVQRELENLRLMEDTLDALISNCAQQLFDITNNLENSALAYVTLEDIRRLRAFQEETVIVVKAPEETKLEVPPPKEDRIQVRLKAGAGPITALTCDIGAGEQSGRFVSLERSRIKTSRLNGGSPGPGGAVQSDAS